jgi:hypothetical protein
MTALAIIALWLLLSVVAGLLIGRGTNVLCAVQIAACTSPPVTAAGKLASNRRRAPAPIGRPQVASGVQRRAT